MPKFRRRRAKPLRPTIEEINAAWAKYYKEKKEANAAARAAKKASRKRKLKNKGIRERPAKDAEILIISSKKPSRDKSKSNDRRKD